MYPSFLPAAVGQLTEPSSIALAESIVSQAIATPISSQPISTSYVCQGKFHSHTPILLIHGFDSSVLEYRRLLPLLAENHPVWAVDLLGFGFTERLLGISYSAATIKIHLYHFWKTVINRPVILVGASMGGAAAIDFAISYPDIVEKLVLMDSAGVKGNSPMSKLIFPPLDYWAAEFLKNEKVRDRICRTAYKNPNLISEDALLCGQLHLGMTNWTQALIAFTKSGGYAAFKKQKFSQIMQQTLILWGDNDKILGTKDANKFHSLILNSKLIWIKDCGHIPHLEQAEITATHILQFCQ
ncbi:alpha/beta fold hydrolase [Anabaena sp. FACHB-1237]|uniref:alpha/beta fold hydrolase n=1 Tax=Anabaena sp. FACHB-1237 TaxID=2692769 RepID=UPI001680DDF0|nr:alpha/beta fold hydrolase [Anabaena sp. FACHB-1237]MBD2137383.1 alpha/beta fold hydrolase [Anabaena sp. FACHB-1237]